MAKIKIPEQEMLKDLLIDWAFDKKKEGIPFKKTQEQIKCEPTDWSHFRKGKRNFPLERLIDMLRRTGEYEIEILVRKKDETL